MYPVESWIIAGIHIWPILRNQLGIAMLRDAGNQCQELRPIASPFARQVASLGKIGYAYFKHLQASIADRGHNELTSRTADVAFLRASQDRVFKLPNGLFYDIHIDPIREKVVARDITVRSFEWALPGDYVYPRFGCSKFIQPIVESARIKSILRASFDAPDVSIAPGFSELVGFFAQNVPAVSVPSLAALVRSANMIAELADYFAAQIKTSGTRMGFLSDYTNNIGMAFNVACSRCGIPSVDIQHGVAGELNCIYGRWSKLPRTGYEVMPSIFWCWSEEDAAAIRSWNAAVSEWHEPVVGGNPWTAIWQEDTHPLVTHFDTIVQKKMINTEKRIVVALQNGFELPDHIFEAIAQSPATWRWLIRYHPCTPLQERQLIRNRIEGLNAQTKLEFELSNDMPLMALLRHVDVLVTQWSAVVLDAHSMGLASVVTHCFGEELFSKEIQEGWVFPAYDRDSLLARIQTISVARKKTRELETNTDTGLDALLLRISPNTNFNEMI